jgi:hypothetical protein
MSITTSEKSVNRRFTIITNESLVFYFWYIILYQFIIISIKYKYNSSNMLYVVMFYLLYYA